MAKDYPRTMMAPLPAPPPPELAASPLPPPPAAKSGNRGLYKAVGFASLALLIVCLVRVSYYNLRTHSSAPLPEPVATAQTNTLAPRVEQKTLPSTPPQPDAVAMAPPHMARRASPVPGHPSP
jgi:hypothetical protein